VRRDPRDAHNRPEAAEAAFMIPIGTAPARTQHASHRVFLPLFIW
jgi:hypothetical protein